MRLSNDFISELRYRNPIEEVISSYVALKRAGSTMRGLCPFHNERTPSFTVYTASSSYYCFGCQNGGDVITFIKGVENLDYMEAVKLLAERAGMSMPEVEYDDSTEKLRRRILEINRETAHFFHKCLMEKADGGIGLKYFAGRGLTPETTVKFGLGYAPESFDKLRNHLKQKGFSEGELILANVCGKSQKTGGAYDRFRKKLIFPIIDLRGNVIAFGGRKFPEDEGAKYINTSDTLVYKKSHNLYALNFAKNTGEDYVLLTEGQMDTIALYQAGFKNVVGAQGTSFTDEQARLLSRFFKEIVVTLDTDGAGQKAAKRAIETLKKTGMKIRVLQLPEGKDPDEYIKTYGAERFRLLLEGANNDVEFELLGERSKHNLNAESGKLDYLKATVDILARQNDEIAINLYAGKIASELSVDKGVLLKQIKQKKLKNRKNEDNKKIREISAPKYSANDVNPEARKYGRAAGAEELILSILMNHSQLSEYVFKNLKAEDFLTEWGRRVYTELRNILVGGREFNLSLLSNGFDGRQMGKIIQIMNKGGFGTDNKKILEDCIKVLFDEREKLGVVSPTEMNDDEFSAAMKHIGKNKRKDG